MDDGRLPFTQTFYEKSSGEEVVSNGSASGDGDGLLIDDQKENEFTQEEREGE